MASRKLLLGIAAVAVIAIGYFAVRGFPPVGPGSEGTVGAAKKYQSEQISAKDVVLQSPEVQRVLQSDSFRRLVSNPETRAILASKDFQKAMGSAQVQAFLATAAQDGATAKALDGALDASAVSGLMGRLATDSAAAAAVGAALSDAAVAKAFDGAAAKAAENASAKAIDGASAKAIDQALGKAIQDAGLAKMLADAAHNAAFAELLSNDAFQAAMSNPAFLGLLSDAELLQGGRRQGVPRRDLERSLPRSGEERRSRGRRRRRLRGRFGRGRGRRDRQGDGRRRRQGRRAAEVTPGIGRARSAPTGRSSFAFLRGGHTLRGATAAGLTLAALSLALSPPADAQLKELETQDLRLIYFDPALTYVTPHAGRCFENALGFHRKLFSYTPSGPRHRAARRLRRQRQRRGDGGAAQLRQGRHGAAQLRLRDRGRERAHQLADEPRARARDGRRPGGRQRALLPRTLPRQGRGRARAAREHPLLLPDRAARRGAALVPGGARGLRRDLDGGRPGPRPGRLRRDGVPLDGEGRRPLLRPARARVRGREGRLPDRGQLLPLRHALPELPGLRATRPSR